MDSVYVPFLWECSQVVSHLALIDTFSERDPVADNPLRVVGMDPA